LAVIDERINGSWQHRAAMERVYNLREMSDTLYLSLWYPNLRLAAMPDKLVAVLGAFAAHGGESRVHSVTVWPVSWSESPVFQMVYGRGERGLEPRQAVEEATELLHEDYAYEFQIGWSLWEADPGHPPHEQGPVRGDPGPAGRARLGLCSFGYTRLRKCDRCDFAQLHSRTGGRGAVQFSRILVHKPLKTMKI